MKLREIATLVAAVATLIAAVTSVYVAVRTREAVYQVHLSVNSRLDQLVAETKAAAHAAGVEEGRDE